MKPKDLSARISNLESLLNHFSFEELTTEEAAYLKNIFNAFKSSMGNDSVEADNDMGETLKRSKNEILAALEYLKDVSKLLTSGPLTQEQRSYINGMQQVSNMLLEKIQKPSPAMGPISSIGGVKELDFNLHHLLRNVLFVNKTLTVSPALKMSIDIDREIPEIIKGWPSLLSHILLHLFGKGIRYMETGSISLRISLIGETKDTSLLEFGLVFQNFEPQNPSENRWFQNLESSFKPFQKWMKKHNLKSDFLRLSESEQGIKFVIPFKKADHRTSIPRKVCRKSDIFPKETISQPPNLQINNWNSLLLECQGNLKILEERLNRWQGQLLGFVGQAKIQLKNADFEGLEKSSIATRNKLVGLPFHDICSLLERMARACTTDKDLRHLRFLYKGLLEEYGNMDKTIVSELKKAGK